MKLVEIKDVRVGAGQIWENNEVYLIPYDKKYVHAYSKNKKPDWASSHEYDASFLKSYFKLTGKLGITHAIEDNKLVEIPREGFQVDDIIERKIGGSKHRYIVTDIDDDNDFWILSVDTKRPDSQIKSTRGSIIGIYGVTHEFVNDMEHSHAE